MTLLAPKVAAAKAVGALVRAAGRGGGTSLPGKVLTRLEPHAIGMLARRLAHGSAVISATNGKTTTAAMAAVDPRAHRRAPRPQPRGANMAGGVASALAAASRRGGRALDGDLGLFEVDEFWLGPVVEELEPRALLLGNLFRDQLDRYGELEIDRRPLGGAWSARGAAARALVLNADDPLVADLGRADRRRARPHRRSSSASTTTALAHRRAPARRRLQALPPLRPSRTSTTRPTSPTSATTTARTAARGARSRRWWRATSSCAASARPPSRCTRPPGTRARRAPAARASTTSTTPSAPRRCAWRSARRSTSSWAGWRRSRRPSAARRRSSSAGARPSILLVKNPAGANEVLRTLALEGERARPVRRAQRPHRRRARRVVGVGRRLGAARPVRAAHDLLGHARGGARAADEVRGHADRERLRVVEPLADGPGRRAGRRHGPLYALPTYTALLELRDLLAARGAVRGHWR